MKSARHEQAWKSKIIGRCYPVALILASGSSKLCFEMKKEDTGGVYPRATLTIER